MRSKEVEDIIKFLDKISISGSTNIYISLKDVKAANILLSKINELVEGE